MSVDAKAFIKGNVGFPEIEAFLKRALGDASIRPAISDESSESAWIEFSDGAGKGRSAFVFRSKIPDAGLDEDILKWAKDDGLTIISLFSDEEGKRITRMIAERFGGWHQPADCREEYERVLMKNPTKEERFAESAEIWKAEAEKLAEAMRAFAEGTRGLDPAVLEAAASAGAGDLDACGRISKAVSALDEKAGTLRKKKESEEG